MHNYSILEGYYYNKQDSDVTYHAKTILRYTTRAASAAPRRLRLRATCR
jgi:hypothetical protein